jgi:anaerobic sulfite reductase subunit A
MYREEASSEHLNELVESKTLIKQANVDGIEVFLEFIGKLKGSDLERAAADLAAEYANLFLNAGNQPVFPYESVYTSPGELLMQKARDEVKLEYSQQGLGRSEKFNEPEDHLAIELEFMSILCQKTIKALRIDDREQGIAYLQKQKEFLEQHLLVWCPRFCNDLVLASESDFYRGIAILTKSYLDTEQETLSMLIEHVQGLPPS